MTAVVFETKGLMDVRSVTIIGAHAKPNSANPIGYFGSGLKFAIAVVLRMGGSITIWIGRDKFTFGKKASTFRGEPLETIVMRVLKDGGKRATTYELPYTTSYGRNWKPWMAFRELESNTRDEGGKTWLVSGQPAEAVMGIEGITRVVVDHPEFAQAAENIDETFLPRAKRSGTLLEAIDGESKYIYYRTMRAKDLNKSTLFTYNVLEQLALTEDRTLMYEFQVRDVVARWVLTEATEEQVEAVITADEDWWEHGLEFPGHVAPSAAFRAVMDRRPKGTSRYAHSYWGSYSGGSIRRGRSGFSLFAHHPKPWKVEGDLVVDGNGDPVFERPDDGDAETWDAVAAAIIRRLDVMPIPGAHAIIDVPPADPAPDLEVILVPRIPATEPEIPF